MVVGIVPVSDGGMVFVKVVEDLVHRVAFGFQGFVEGGIFEKPECDALLGGGVGERCNQVDVFVFGGYRRRKPKSSCYST